MFLNPGNVFANSAVISIIYKVARSFNNLRVGKKFKLINFGESSEFEILDIMANGNCLLKDIHTLEQYELADLIRYGKGEDFDVSEI